MDFDGGLQRHLAAIRSRDLDEFLATVANDVVVVLPNGRVLEGREAVGEFHRDWFGDPDWSMDVTVRGTRVFGSAGHALADVVYDDLDPAGQPYRMTYVLGMLFERVGDAWLLVADQNTPT